jgi:hypothetical protein
VSAPLILRTPKQRRFWLILENDGRYRKIHPRRLRLRFRELGLSHHLERLGRKLGPAEIADRVGAIVTPSVFAAAERGEQ